MTFVRFLLPLLVLLSWSNIGLGAAEPPVRTLRVLAWPGYADPDVIMAFEQRHHVHVDLTLIATDQVLWERMSANDGADFDVFAVNTAELQRYIDHHLAQPVDPAAIPNTQRQLPRFRNLEAIAGLTRDGKAWGIPYTYAEMGLIYDRSQFAQPPDSIEALWDPQLRGKVLAYDAGGHNFSLAAQALGKASPFRLAPSDWPKAVARLIELRRNVLGFYTRPDEATRLFRKHKVALLFANYGMQQVQALRAAGADIGYAIPKEGALAWLDCWVISQGTRDLALANAWIDHMLEPKVSGLLVTRQGLANTIAEPDGGAADARRLWLEPMEDPMRRDRLWERIVSGDNHDRVMAP
jgi:putative spermidine/putrescine transport system substrate-binding protein